MNDSVWKKRGNSLQWQTEKGNEPPQQCPKERGNPVIVSERKGITPETVSERKRETPRYCPKEKGEPPRQCPKEKGEPRDSVQVKKRTSCDNVRNKRGTNVRSFISNTVLFKSNLKKKEWPT